MLDFMHRLAARLTPARTALIGIAAAGALAAATALIAFEGTRGDAILLPALVVLLWSLLALGYIDLFARIPRAGPTDAGLRRTWVRRLARRLYWILATGFVILGLVAIDVSLTIAREWLEDRSEPRPRQTSPPSPAPGGTQPTAD